MAYDQDMPPRSNRSNHVQSLSGILHVPVCRNLFRVCLQMLLSSALKSDECLADPASIGSDHGWEVLVLIIRLVVSSFIH